MQFTPAQKQAVEYRDGPLLIIAGAGTGKTTVLVEKVKYIIEKKLALPHEILALTFTEKAAGEMEERVDRALPYGYFQMWISTFHSFCDDILRQEAAHIGISPAYRLQTQAESVIFLRKNVFHFALNYFRPLGNPNKFLEGLLQHFSRLRDEDVSEKQYVSWVKGARQKTKGKRRVADEIEMEKNSELAHAYQKYQELKIKNNIMDFGDLIFYTLQLFRTRPNILSQYKRKFKYILVDEFQDTNVAQYELIKLLAPPDENPRLTVVGDDSQSIYKFRGAAISNILQFMREYKRAKNVVLLENFRSRQTILDAAYRLIKHNDPDTLEAKLAISKNLVSMKGKGQKDDLRFYLGQQGEAEADFVVEEIAALHQKKYEWSDMAILVRAHAHADAFTRGLSRHGIPYQFLGQSALFRQPEIKDLIAYVNVLTDITDSASFYRVITMDIFSIDKIDLSRLIAFARKTNLSLFESVEVYLSFFYPELSRSEYEHLREYLFIMQQSTRKKLHDFFQMVRRHLSKIPTATAGEILYDFLEESGLLKNLSAAHTEVDEKKATSVSRFFELLKTFETNHADASVFSFAEYITMSMEFGESPHLAQSDLVGQNAVNILTVHGAKGLEFGVVFLVNVTADRFPTRERRELFPLPDALIKEILPEGDYHLEEERRLFYVGVTRAKDKVYMSAARHYAQTKRPKKISPFVAEALGDAMVRQAEALKETEKKQLSLFDFEKKSVPIVSSSQAAFTSFSFSQIETYKICPLRYKYQYVIKIPVPKNSAAAFGESIHRGLQKFYSLHKGGKHPSLDTLLELYDASWIPIGYQSKTHERQQKEKGRQMLAAYFATYYRADTRILDLEKRFTTRVLLHLSIVGKIDRVDERADGTLEIIDYKTGKKPEGRELEKNLQLSLYALAASDPGLYGKAVCDITLTFYFLQTNEVISLQKTEEDLVTVRESIIQSAAEINASSFAPRPGPWCSFCPFKINCEAWQ